MKKEKRRPRQRSQVHHKPNTDGSGLRQYGHKPIYYVFGIGPLNRYECKGRMFIYCNKEKKELFVLRRISIIKMAKVVTYYMLLQFLL